MGRVHSLFRLAVDTAYRRERMELRRLSMLPRREPGQTSILGKPFRFADGCSFVDQYRAFITRDYLTFDSTTPTPLIIDGGGNVGLTILYWKRLHPGARIHVFEPDPGLLAMIRENARAFGLDGITYHPEALWKGHGEVRFSREGSDSGRLSALGSVGSELTVPTVPLSDFLTEEVELLKLDIEGAETEVIAACADKLHLVKRLYIEYHSFLDKHQDLPRLLAILQQAGFRVHIREGFASPRPFAERRTYLGMDNMLDIFACRD